MNLRDMREDDVGKLKQWYLEQGWKYKFPDLAEEQFMLRRAIEEDDGTLVGVAIARRTVELYFLGNRTWRTPVWRLMAFAALHEDMRQRLSAMGYMDAHAWIPPEICRSFGRRLIKSFNWVKNEWSCFSRSTHEG